jgi:hypothetical protein
VSRPIIIRASRKAETCKGMAHDIRERFKSFGRPMHDDAKREVGTLEEAAELFVYFGNRDRISFGHLCRLRDAAARLRDAATPSEMNEARAEFDRIYQECLTFTEGED